MIFMAVCFFVLGTIFGSFYNVLGYRIPKGESIIYPGSHCTKCGHVLKAYELIPIISFLLLGGKCKKCKEKISWFYPMFELFTGMLFCLSYLVFGLTLNCLLSILFMSMLIIVIISDYQTMTIPDSILLVFSILIIIVKYCISGLSFTFLSILYGIICFIIMFLIKKLGDLIFKRESMGGGDIKLLGVFGIVLGIPLSMISIFLASIIALPISLISLKHNVTHEVPFGPYLALAAIILFLTKIDINTIINFIS